MTDSGSIFHRIFTEARDAGFDSSGIARVPEPGSGEDYAELQHFAPWVEAGRAGEMEYLKRRSDAGLLLRSSLRLAIPWARSVIVCVANYNSSAPKSTEAAPEDSGWVARYAWTGQPGADGSRPSDYHNVLLKRLRRMESKLHEHLGEFESKCFVDTGPLVERIYAKYAGVGWTGKNTCLINQKLGSWLFLGVIVTSIDLPEPARAELAEDRCGSCRRCIDACPTGALTDPYQMDASLCIAYLTIEKRGAIPENLREQMGRQIFGCDICQDVCPWNRKAPITSDSNLTTRAELVNPALDWLAGLDAEGFGRLFFGSPVKRARYEGLRRNVAIAMGNSGLEKFAPQLREWAAGSDPVLAESARWALNQIERAQAGRTGGEPQLPSNQEMSRGQLQRTEEAFHTAKSEPHV